jgi:putative integral membrane protein (TIGR02587 family)
MRGAAAATKHAHPQHTWAEEGRDLLRGVGGAAIIGVPLLYTMEVWQVATVLPTPNVLVLLALGFAANVVYNYFSGFRDDQGLRSALADATEALAVGALLALVLLFLLRVIDADTPLADAASKVALEALPLSIGASVANTQFDPGRRGQETQGVEPGRRHRHLRDAGIALAGSLIFAANVAPTEEIALIASRMPGTHLLAMVVFSLLLSYGLIFVADFGGVEERRRGRGALQSPFGETLLAYGIALGVAFACVIGFHGVGPGDSMFSTVALVIVLGLPTTVGGAAGRLLV